MPYITVTDNVTGEVKEIVLNEQQGEVQSEREPRKAPKQASKTKQTESADRLLPESGDSHSV